MKRTILKTGLAAFMALSLTMSAHAEDATPTKVEVAPPTTTPTSNTTNDTQGLTNAYNFTVPSPAPSTCCGSTYDHGNANGNATIIMQNFNQKLAAMQLAIIEALRLGTGQLSGNLASQTAANHTLADQQDDRSTVKSVEAARMSALVDSTSGSTSCYVITGSSGGSLAGTTGASAQVLASELDKWVRGESTYSEKGQEIGDFTRLDAYCNTYATTTDVKSKLCKNVGKYPAASVNAGDSIFYAGIAGNADVYDTDRAAATNAFILNSVAPVTYSRLSEAEAQTVAGRRQAARQKTQMARESLGRFVMVDYAKKRDPQSSGLTLAAWAAARVAKMQGMTGIDVSKLSYQQWLAIYAKGFLLDSEALMSSDQNTATALKDLKNMLAVLNYTAYDQLEEMQKINLQLAVQSAILNEGTRTDGIFSLKKTLN